MTAPLHLCRRWAPGSAPPVPPRGGVALRQVRPFDAPDVGRVMWSAFLGKPDEEFDSVSEAESEVAQTLDGKWGPLLPHASLVAVIGACIVAATLVVSDKAHAGMPLLAYAATAPERQGQGIGGWLIGNSVQRLDAGGIKELHLAVAPANPARRLYERLGFELVP